ncbi:MAG: M20/M25/M40 family metallo-hydrolase [Pseudomonadota bacterium]
MIAASQTDRQNKELAQALRAGQDSTHDINLLCEAITYESVTGNEANFVRFLHTQMTARQLSPTQADFLPNRPNIWGQRQGTRGEKQCAPRLLFIGHSDTVHARDWGEEWRGTAQENPFAGTLTEDEIWGRGSVDLKGGICASLAALDLLDQIGITLRGDVAFAFVGDEESGEPGSGISAGIKDYVARVQKSEIEKADFAIYLEPTKLAIYPSQIGFFITDVAITGKSAYFGTPEHGIDALKAAHQLQAALFVYAQELTDTGSHPLVGPAHLLITQQQAGGLIAVPGHCHMSLIRKLRPGEDMDHAVAEFEARVHQVPFEDGITVAMTYPAGRNHRAGGTPTEVPADLPAIRQLTNALRASTSPDEMPHAGAIEGAPYWSEMPFLADQLGCPTVYCAPGDISLAHTSYERLKVDEYLASIRAFALFIADFCGTHPPSQEGDIS